MMSSSARDLEAVRERRAFVAAEIKKQRAAEDRQQYQQYLTEFEQAQHRTPPAERLQPLTWEDFTRDMPEESDPRLRAILAVNRALVRQAAHVERDAVSKGSPDPGFVLPESAVGKKATYEQARQINGAEFKRWTGRNPELYLSPANVDRLTDYLLQQGVKISTSDCYQAAWDRLESLGFLEQRPEPEPIQEEPHTEQPERVDDGSMLGWVPETGETRLWNRREIQLMSPERYRQCFKLSSEKRGMGLAMMEPLR